MSGRFESTELRRLLEHQGWVRGLARRLVGDAQADEVAQETWVAALQHPPERLQPDDRPGARRWLAAVARNAARQLRRGEARREERERRAARAEATPTPDELLQRAQLQRRVAEAVEALAEPYRATLLMRYFEELPPREIARLQGVPVETVRTRLGRGIEQLRARLDARHGGDRSQWLPALALLARRPAFPLPPGGGSPGGPLGGPGTAASLAPVPPLTLGVALMNTKLALSLAGAAALGVSAWLVLREPPAEPAAAVAEAGQPHPGSALARPADGVHAAAAPVRESDLRSEVELPAAAAPAAPEPEPAGSPIVGRVLGPDGAPRARVRVALSTREEVEPVSARSDAGGRFELTSAAASGSLAADDGSWSTVYASSWHRDQEREPLVVVAPHARLEGRVQDEDGQPVPAARVSVILPEGFRSRFAVVLDEAERRSWSAPSDELGGFALDEVPLVEEATVRVDHPDHQPVVRPLEELVGAFGVITLPRLAVAGGMVRGIVLDPYGHPVEAAHVALGFDVDQTAADGTFALALDDPDSVNAWLHQEPTTLTAVAPGWLPAVFEPPSDAEGARAWPAHVTLELAGEPLELTGTVVDHRGEPVPEARVWLVDPTMLGAVDGSPTPIEHLLAGSPGSMWHFVEVDAHGAFRLEGLMDRRYTLRAMDPATLVMEDFGPFDARGPGGPARELALPTDRVHPRVGGRVLAPDGMPIAGASVTPWCDAYQSRAAGQVVGTSHWTRPGTTTDAEGRFLLENVPTSLVYLRVDGDEILPLEFGRVGPTAADGGLGAGAATGDVNALPGDSIEELELRVARRAHLQVETARPGADQFAVLDAGGRRLVLNVMMARSRWSGTEAPIHPRESGGEALGGRSDTVALPETGVTLVLLSGGRELGRVPIELAPGEVTSVVY